MTNSVIPQDQTALANPKKTKTMRELGAVDISGIQQDIIDIPEELWKSQDYGKPNKFESLGVTEHIVFKFIHNYDDHLSGYDLPIWEEWKDRLQPVLDATVKPYGYADGDFSRVMLAKLPVGGKISLHIDQYDSSINTHKIHIPIQTNPDVEFWINRKRYNFKTGYAYEVNNKALHGGINQGNCDRINLIIEYYQK